VQQKTLHELSIQGLYESHLKQRLNANALKQLTPHKIAAAFAGPNTQLVERHD